MKTLRELYDNNASFALAITAFAYMFYATVVVVSLTLLVVALTG